MEQYEINLGDPKNWGNSENQNLFETSDDSKKPNEVEELGNTENSIDFQNLGKSQKTEAKRLKKTAMKDRTGRVFPAIIVAACIAIFVLLWLLGALDGIKRAIIYAGEEKDVNGCVEMYSYSSDKSNQFAIAKKSLVVVSEHSIMVIGDNDEVKYSTTVNFSSPAIAQGDDFVATYDIGGKQIYALNDEGILYTKDIEGEIISATVSANNTIAVTYNKSGYKAAVVVLNSNGETVYEFSSAERFLLAAYADQSKKMLAVVTAQQNDGVYNSQLSLYRLDSKDSAPQYEYDLGNEMVYDLTAVDGTLCAIGENSLQFISFSGKTEGNYNYNGTYLRKFSSDASGFISLILGDYKAGNSARIVMVNAKGTELGTCAITDEVLSLSTLGRHVSVLFGDRLVTYTKDLKVSDELKDVSSAKVVIAREDGTILLAGSNVADLYIP